VVRRVLLVGRTRYRLPLSPALEAKFSALRRELDVRVLASAADDGPEEARGFALVRPFRIRALDGLAFWLSLPFRVASQLRNWRPDAVVAQSPYDGAAALVGRVLSRSDAKVLVEVHGDWRTATRLYGSRERRLLAPLADRIALASLRRADGVRAVSGYTARLMEEAVRAPDDIFPAFMDLEPFAHEPAPLPERPQALFVGVLELYKNIDGLADAWRLAASRVPEAGLVIVGSGALASVVEQLVADLPDRTRWFPRLAAEEVSQALDESTLLVLPSRSEGLGRVVVESMSRGRAVIATRVGGPAELLDDGRTGLLVAPGDTHSLADALVRVLSDRELAARLGGAARAEVDSRRVTPGEFASRLRAFVERMGS
jgi:glycosyltransferase involved in cell wall biosynthesis